MRSRSREINTLNLSMLDIIAGAMAAFLILMVILLPYYERETVNQEIMAELHQAVAEVERLRRVAEKLAKQVKSGIRPNLVLYIEWFSRDVVDLILVNRKNDEPAWHDWPDDEDTEPRRTGGKSSVWLNV